MLKNPISNIFECALCCGEHMMPAKQFPINKSLLGIIEQKPKEVYRGKIVEEFNENLEYIKRKKEEIDRYINNGEKIIKKHCEYLKKKINDSAISAILKIYQSVGSMTIEINRYEYASIWKHHRRLQRDKKYFEETINQIDKFHEEWSAYLNKLDYEEDVVIKANELALTLKKKARMDKIKVINSTYNTEFIEFESNPNEIDKNIIGSIKHLEWFSFSYDYYGENHVNTLKKNGYWSSS